MNNKDVLQSILINLKAQGQLPKQIDFSMVGDRYWCVTSDEIIHSKRIISEEVFTGMAFDKETALLKSLSERVERLAFIEGSRSNHLSCKTDASDGFAAIPQSLGFRKATESAWFEAVERYVWASWWDDLKVAHKIETILPDSIQVANSSYLQSVFAQLSLKKLQVVTPCVLNMQSSEVLILLGSLENGGFISGGACGRLENHESTFYRGLDELFRHGMGYKKYLIDNLDPKSFYEKRLLYFATGEGSELVLNRLAEQGTESISLPGLAIDKSVPTGFSDYYVHRCYFRGQPPFVGGALERLCL